MNKKRILSLVAATMLSVAVLAGCGSKEEGMKDGKYEVEAAAADKNGYKSTLTLEVKDGKIVAADYDEISTEGASKQSDAEYNKKMKEFGKVTNPEEAFPALEKAIVEKQSAEVDAFTGATSSSNNFKKLAAKAIENATAGNTEEAIVE